MSILLESINQPGRKDENDDAHGDVPSIGDSHFDDEMLSDVWLLAKLKFWKRLTYISIAVLVFFTILFYVFLSQKNEALAAVSEKLDTILSEKQTAEKQTVMIDSSQSSDVQKVLDNSDKVEQLDSIDGTQPSLPQTSKIATINKSEYQPKLVSKIEETQKITPNKIDTLKSEESPNLNQISSTLSFESLSDAEKNEMPELEISSYAVSNNPEKSFVVLNGNFYAQNETIAPNLTLVLIDKDGIVVRYKNRLIRKKYSI